MNTAVVERLDPTQTEPPARRGAEVVPATPAPARVPALRTPPGTTPAARRGDSVAWSRAALVVGSTVAAFVAWRVAAGASSVGDPELATLLRAMAVIKGLLAASAAALVGWRLGQPLSPALAATYVGCAALLFASTVLIWQLAFIPAAAVLFHAAGLVGAVVAMREGRQVFRFGARAARSSVPRTG